MNNEMLEVRKYISALRMADDVKSLIQYGPRHAGTSNEHKAASYVESEMRKALSLVRVDRVEGINAWKLHDTRVKVIDPVEQELTSIALLGSASTPKEGLTAELCYVGRGTFEDYNESDLAGKIIMRDPPRALTLDNTSDESSPQGPVDSSIKRGAVGFLEHARIPGKILQMPLLSGPLGLPVPAVAVTYEDGQYLKELLREWYAIPKGSKRTADHQPVNLRIWVDAKSYPSYGLNVIGRIDGEEKKGEIICLVAHHDNANGPGACDNATAVAVNLETARVLSKMSKPKRTIEFLSCTGEEYGEAGSFEYVKRYIDHQTSRYKGCVNMDLVGNGDHLYYIKESICMGKLVQNDAILNEKLVGTCNDLGYHIEGTPLEYAGDDGPFIMAGVPTAYLCKLISSTWPYLHTYMDDFSVVDINGLSVMVEIVANYIWRLANE